MVSYFVTFFPVKTFSSMLDVVHFFFLGGGQGGVGGWGGWDILFTNINKIFSNCFLLILFSSPKRGWRDEV